MILQQDATRLTGWQRFRRFPVTRIALFLLALATIAFVFSVPVLGLLKLFGLHTKHHLQAAEMVNELYLALCTVGAYALMVRVVEKRSFASAGFTVHGLGPETGTGLLIGGVLFSLVIGLTSAFGGYHVLGINLHFAWFVPLILYLAVAVAEEIIFRGYIFQTLEARWGSGIALSGSAAVFGLIHLFNPISGLTPAEKLAGPLFIVFEASILMSAGYLLTRRLWLPIGIHWGWNFFENSVYGATDSGLPANPVYTLIHAQLYGPFALTGGPFGPEAGVFCLIIGTGAGLALLGLAVKRGQWIPRSRLSGPTLIPTQEALP